MGRASALAAAALLLALGAAACKPSSLTPFTGRRAPEDPDESLSGIWRGTNSTGLEIFFLVGGETVSALQLRHRSPACTRTFTAGTAEIIGGDFTVEVLLDQGRFLISGTFTSPTTCSGSYLFEGLALAGTCPTTGGGTFIASKAP